MALKKDLVIEAGATFFFPFVWRQPKTDPDGNVLYTTDPTTGVQVPQPGNPVNLTGYMAKMQTRRNLTDPTAAITLTETIITSVDDVDPATSAIYIVPLLGYTGILISFADTELLASGIYDLKLTSAGGFRYRVLGGKVRLSAEVTQ